ncbi:MAG TPA: hypothetical protein VMQ17_08830 [Candidatus Sulfotelmatobacter sp.]|nr:hypothetical protein [Candidatus Sulfotelmatobacter sp.]
MAGAQNFIQKALPWIGKAVGAFAASGPIGLLTVAAQGIGEIVGKNVPPTTDAISAAIAGATPDQLIAMKKVDDDFAAQMKQMGFTDAEELEQIFAGDRASAREMQTQTRSWLPGALAIFITLGFFSLLALIAFHATPASSEKALDIMLGSLATAWIMVVGFYFGSSSGHERATELLAQSTPVVAK